MITLFELKNKGLCRCFIRTPFYIKNLVLLLQLAFILAVVYLIYFRKDGLVIQNITKILKGLNSETFNYLEAHSDSLRLTKLLNNYQAEISSNQFMDDCVRINKPCKFEGLAQKWAASDNWQFDSDNGYKYLIDTFGDQQVTVYKLTQEDFDLLKSTTDGDSFKEGRQITMTYKDFVEKMSKDDSADYNLKESADMTLDKFQKDVQNPKFFDNINKFYKIEILQGQQFVAQGHYQREEQMLCSIDGVLQVKLIPHVYRQEVYAGKDKIIVDEQSDQKPQNAKRIPTPDTCSPVNFFEPDHSIYPLFEDIDRKYTVLLHEGDCLYVPAFYYHQYIAKTEQQPETKIGLKPSSIAVSLKYQGNSILLDQFMRAVETNILT